MTDVLHVSRHNTRSCPWWFLFIYYYFLFCARLVLLSWLLIVSPGCWCWRACVAIVPCYPPVISQTLRPDLFFFSSSAFITRQPPIPTSIAHTTSASRPRLGNSREREKKKRKTQSDSHSSNIYLSLHPSQGFIPLQPTEWLMQTWLMWFFPPRLVARLLRHYTSKNARHCAVMNTNSTPFKKKLLALYWRFE